MQPSKPSFKSPMRLVSGELGYPMSGIRERLGLGRSPELRVLDLYPDYTVEQVQTLLRSLGDDAVAELKRRKVELETLRRDLDRWAGLPWCWISVGIVSCGCRRPSGKAWLNASSGAGGVSPPWR
ncbi:hypothetical protein THH46_03415 [Pseudomonas sp. NA13]